MMDAYVTLSGNATGDPDLRYVGQGTPVCSFTVAVNHREKNRDTGVWEDGEASFYRVSCWRDLAENAAESIQKGTPVTVTGSLRLRRWETSDGRSGTSGEVTADSVGVSLQWNVARIDSGGPKPSHPGNPTGQGARGSQNRNGGRSRGFQQAPQGGSAADPWSQPQAQQDQLSPF